MQWCGQAVPLLLCAGGLLHVLKCFPNTKYIDSQSTYKGLLCNCSSLLTAHCLPLMSQPCPVDAPNFRAEQCSRLNNQSIGANWKLSEEGTDLWCKIANIVMHFKFILDQLNFVGWDINID